MAALKEFSQIVLLWEIECVVDSDFIPIWPKQRSSEHLMRTSSLLGSSHITHSCANLLVEDSMWTFTRTFTSRLWEGENIKIIILEFRFQTASSRGKWLHIYFFDFCLFQIVKMLITLVVVFALCWFPLNLFNLVLDLDPSLLDHIQTREDERLLIGLYYSCHWLAMASCFANPIIYSFFNESFRVSH